MAELADLLRGVADGTPPATDTDLVVVPPPDERSIGVLAFPGQHVVLAHVSTEWVRSWLPCDDLGAPLSAPFLTLLSSVTGRAIGTTDAVLVARGHGKRRGQDLTEITDSDHPRVLRAQRHRADVQVWECPGGVLTLGRGVAGRWEVSVEVEPALRGFGLGRGLFGAALGLVPAGEPVWAQIAPGNAASLRAVLAVGYRPVGAEVLLEPRAADEGEPIAWFGDYEPELDWSDEVEVPAPSAGADEPNETPAIALPEAPAPSAQKSATAAEIAAAEAQAAAELDEDEDAELAERDEPRL